VGSVDACSTAIPPSFAAPGRLDARRAVSRRVRSGGRLSRPDPDGRRDERRRNHRARRADAELGRRARKARGRPRLPTVENHVLQPTSVGRAARGSGFFVLQACSSSRALFGLVGAMTAVSIAATAQILLREVTASRRREWRRSAEPRASSRTRGRFALTLPQAPSTTRWRRPFDGQGRRRRDDRLCVLVDACADPDFGRDESASHGSCEFPRGARRGPSVTP